MKFAKPSYSFCTSEYRVMTRVLTLECGLKGFPERNVQISYKIMPKLGFITHTISQNIDFDLDQG